MASVLDAVQDEDILGATRAMRERIAVAIDDPATPPRDLAALTKRLFDLNREIREVQADEEKRLTKKGIANDREAGPAEDSPLGDI